MPPVLDPHKSKVDGLAFIGLSLSRRSAEHGHPDSQTHQTAFDLNEVLDRDYKYIFSTNDDGWLVGGGEPGPPKSYKLAAPDSGHVEILRIGTYNREWGGITAEDVITAIREGHIMIPEMTVVPTAVVANHDAPPELEIRFDMEPALHDPEPSSEYDALPVNWQLRFLHNQLFRYFEFPSRFCPGAFHSTILRKAEFRSPAAESSYFSMCDKAVKRWRQLGPQPLLPHEKRGNIQTVVSKAKALAAETSPSPNPYNCGGLESVLDAVDNNIRTIVSEVVSPEKNQSPSPNPHKCGSLETVLDAADNMLTPVPDQQAVGGAGVWLFTDRKTITHHFEPNFFPPYDTPEKRELIHSILGEEWDPISLSWKATPVLPKPKLLPQDERDASFDPVIGISNDDLTETREDAEGPSPNKTSSRFQLRKMWRSHSKNRKQNNSTGAEISTGLFGKIGALRKDVPESSTTNVVQTRRSPTKKPWPYRKRPATVTP